MSQQLTVNIEDGQLKISIGIALLAFAIQAQEQWSEDFHVADIRHFARSISSALQREEEDGSTLIHRMLDAAGNTVLERGDVGVDEGSVEVGLEMAKAILDRAARPPQSR